MGNSGGPGGEELMSNRRLHNGTTGREYEQEPRSKGNQQVRRVAHIAVPMKGEKHGFLLYAADALASRGVKEET